MSEPKFRVGYSDGTGFAGGRQNTTCVTYFSDEAEIEVSICGVHWSYEYDCNKVAKFIADALNASPVDFLANNRDEANK